MAITKHLGALSLVVPFFGRHWHGDFSEITVHLNLGGATWRQLSLAEVTTFLEVVP
jgi:hypothetical protein